MATDNMNGGREEGRLSIRSIIGICGIGQMGSSAAIAFQRAGHRVLLWARDAAKLRAVETTLAQLAAWSTEHLGPPKRAGGDVVLEPDLFRLDDSADVVLDCIIEPRCSGNLAVRAIAARCFSRRQVV